MNYTLLIYLDHARFTALPKEEQNRVHRECGAWHEELVRAGQTRSATGLQPPETATTLRLREGRLLATDGPFAETKETLGGLEQLMCRDLDEALAIARRFPGLLNGYCTVEIRPEVADGRCEA